MTIKDSKNYSAIIQPYKNPWVVCEATGGYERPLFKALYQAHIQVSVLNPAWVRAFAKSEGVKAKTDPIDAKMLLRFAQEKPYGLHPLRIPQLLSAVRS